MITRLIRVSKMSWNSLLWGHNGCRKAQRQETECRNTIGQPVEGESACHTEKCGTNCSRQGSEQKTYIPTQRIERIDRRQRFCLYHLGHNGLVCRVKKAAHNA